MLKNTFLFTLFLSVTFMMSAQDFSGYYQSFETSYKDNRDASLNFREHSKHNIAVAIDKSDNETDYVMLQDPRMPDRILDYEIISDVDVFKENTITMYIYKAYAVHLKEPILSKIVFYLKEDNTINLMVYDDNGSQVWFNLEKLSNITPTND